MTNKAYSQKVYKQKVSEFEKRIDSFRILPCSISRITQDIIKINEAMKDADHFYMNLTADFQEKEVGTFTKSNELTKKYHMILRNIDKICECKPSS